MTVGRGHWLGDVTMPVGFQPLDIGADFVAGRLRKAPDHVGVAVFALLPPGQ